MAENHHQTGDSVVTTREADRTVGIRPSSGEKGIIHATYGRVEREQRNGVLRTTLCGRAMVLLPIEARADGDRPCRRCFR